jgi:membrane protease YdiL (CAAX protease family)
VFPGAPWGVGEAFIIFFASIAVAGTFSLVLAQAMASDSSSIQSRIIYIFLTSVILYAFLLAGTFYSVVARHHSTPSALGLKLAGLGKGFAWGLGLGMPLFVGALGLAYLSQQITGPSNPTNLSRSMNQLATSGVGAAFVFLLVFTLVVLAPVCEEIFFRGYLYPALRNRMNMQPAMLLNGILFAAAHFEIVGFLPRMFLGYGLCYMYEKNHNLSASMLGHALYNGLLIVLFGVFNIF